jgi:hypothetical protein
MWQLQRKKHYKSRGFRIVALVSCWSNIPALLAEKLRRFYFVTFFGTLPILQHRPKEPVIFQSTPISLYRNVIYFTRIFDTLFAYRPIEPFISNTACIYFLYIIYSLRGFFLYPCVIVPVLNHRWRPIQHTVPKFIRIILYFVLLLTVYCALSYTLQCVIIQ